MSLKKVYEGKNLTSRLATQIEFYMSDRNLSADDFFRGLISKSEDGMIDTEVLLKCNRVAALTTSLDSIKEALKEASTLKTNDDGSKFGRVEAFDTEAAKPFTDSSKNRAVIVVKNIPKDTPWTAVREALELCANVGFVKILSSLGAVAPSGKRARDEDDDADSKDGEADGAKRARVGEDGSKAPVAEDGAEGGAEGGAAAGAGGPAVAADSLTAHAVLNLVGLDSAAMLAKLREANITIGDQAIAFDLLDGTALANFWVTMEQGDARRRAKREAAQKKKEKKKPREAEKTLKFGPTELTGYTAISSHFMNLLKSETHGEALTGDNFETLKGLLCYHPSAAEKVKDLKALSLGPSTEFPDTVCFHVIRKDDSKEDFSWRKCLQHALKASEPVVDPSTVTV